MLKQAALTVPFAFFLLSACTSSSQFIDGRTDLRLPDPENAIVVLFARGAGEFDEKDVCVPSSFPAFGGFSTPRVLENLSKRRDDVHVYFVCDQDMYDENGSGNERRRITPCEPGFRIAGEPVDNGEHLKVCQRTDAIEVAIAAMQAANPELTTDRIFLTGTSTGAWASLLVAARNPDAGYHVIAFAPAFAGELARERLEYEHKTEKYGPTIDTIKCGEPQKWQRQRVHCHPSSWRIRQKIYQWKGHRCWSRLQLARRAAVLSWLVPFRQVSRRTDLCVSGRSL